MNYRIWQVAAVVLVGVGCGHQRRRHGDVLPVGHFSAADFPFGWELVAGEAILAAAGEVPRILHNADANILYNDRCHCPMRPRRPRTAFITTQSLSFNSILI